MNTVRRRAGRATYSYRVRMPSGEWREFGSGLRDKRAAEQMAADHQKRIDRGEVGLLDPFESTKSATLTALRDDYAKSLAGSRRSERYRRGVGDRLALAFQVMGVRGVQDVTMAKADEFLAKLLVGEGLPPMKPRTKDGKPIPRGPVSATTRDRYAEALRSFGAWLVATDRWAVNPFGKLRAIAGDDDRTMEHRAWNPDEIGKLIEAATTRPVQQWAATHRTSEPADLVAKLDALRAEGWRRSVLYEFAAYSGLRLNECATLTWADVVLDGAEPCVTVQARNAKNRKRGQSVPLVPWVVTALAELQKRNKADAARAGKPMVGQSDLVFDVKRGLLEALRKDAQWAFGAVLGLHDAQGRTTTFHGFRASTCTMLHRAGVALAVAVRIMRHADPKLTIETYAKLDALTDGHRELAKLQAPLFPSTPASTSNAPQRAAVGCSVPLAAAGSAIADRLQDQQHRGLAPGLASPYRSVPEPEAGGEDGGRCRSRTCDPQLVELML